MRGLLKFFLSLMVLFALPLSSAIAASAYVHDLKGTLTASVGNGSSNAASKYAAARGLQAGASDASSMTGTPGAWRCNTAFSCPVYGPGPKSVNNTSIDRRPVSVRHGPSGG